MLKILIFLYPVLAFCSGELFQYIKPLQMNRMDSGINGIDMIYCINLDIRTERWVAMQQRLEQQGIYANRVSAVNGWSDLSKKVRKKLKAPNKADLRAGQIGCCLSHLSILKHAKDRGYLRIMILEDDIEFTSDIKQVEEYLVLLSEKDPQWDVLFLDGWNGEKRGVFQPIDTPGSKMSKEIQKPKETAVQSKLDRIYYRHDLHGYIVSRKGIAKILNHFHRNSLRLAVDIELNHIDQIRMYETKRDFVQQLYGISDTIQKPPLK